AIRGVSSATAKIPLSNRGGHGRLDLALRFEVQGGRMRSNMRMKLLILGAIVALCVQTAWAQRGGRGAGDAAPAGDPQVKATIDAMANAIGMIRGAARQEALWSI